MIFVCDQKRLQAFATALADLVESLPEHPAARYAGSRILTEAAEAIAQLQQAGRICNGIDDAAHIRRCVISCRGIRSWLLMLRRKPLLPWTETMETLLAETTELIRAYAGEAVKVAGGAG